MIAMPATPMKISRIDLLREASAGAAVVGAWTEWSTGPRGVSPG